MNMRQFIRENREEIDQFIKFHEGTNQPPLNNNRREMWINNTDKVSSLAKSKGVKIND